MAYDFSSFEFRLGAILIAALVLTFFIAPSESKFPKGDIFLTVNENHDFSKARPGNRLAPASWYYGNSLAAFPFSVNKDIVPWDTNEAYLNNGLFLANVTDATSIFTSTYTFADIKSKYRFSSNKTIRITYSYSVPGGIVDINSGSHILLFYSADGTNSVNSQIFVNTRNPEIYSCADGDVSAWKPCEISAEITGDNIALVTNFYHDVENFRYAGLLYYPAGDRITGITVKQIKVEALVIPENARDKLREYINKIIEKVG